MPSSTRPASAYVNCRSHRTSCSDVAGKTSHANLAPIAALAVIVIATTTAQPKTMKIRLTLDNGMAITATLIESETTRDFVSLLPLTLTMNDLFGREKFGHLPRAISTDGKRTHTYEVGDVAYWSPG